MNNSTKPQPEKKIEPSIKEQSSLILLTLEEQTLIKGGATCNCKTNDKRIPPRR